MPMYPGTPAARSRTRRREGRDRQFRDNHWEVFVMRYLVITDDATPEQLREAIGHLRSKQRLAVIESTRLEIQDDIDELLDLLPRPALMEGGAVA